MNIDPKKIAIRPANLAEKAAAREFMEMLTGTKADLNQCDNDYPSYVVYHEGEIYGWSGVIGTPVEKRKIIDFSQIHTLFLEKMVKIKLNDEYTAEVTKNGIQVGCVKISFDIFDQISKAVAELRA